MNAGIPLLSSIDTESIFYARINAPNSCVPDFTSLIVTRIQREFREGFNLTTNEQHERDGSCVPRKDREIDASADKSRAKGMRPAAHDFKVLGHQIVERES